MYLSIIAILVASCLPKALGQIPCNQIGVGSYADGNGVLQKQLDPFTPGQGFNIVPSEQCYLRFQNPAVTPGANQMQFGEQLMASRVTQSTWTTSVQNYVDTCNAYTGGFGSNSMLWLTGSYEPYQYAGILLRSAINAQGGLAQPVTVVTYLLPSGVSKVTTVSSASDTNCQRLSGAGGVGLQGTVNPNTDYAYAPLVNVARGLAARYTDPRNTKIWPFEWSSLNGPFVTANMLGGGCTVIDFRTMPAYMQEIESYADSEVCEWDPNVPQYAPGRRARNRRVAGERED